VVFPAGDGNLVPNDNNRATDVFARDLGAPSVELISTRDANTASISGDVDSLQSRNGLSTNGRFVTFRSWATDLVTNQVNPGPNVFVRDLAQRITWLVNEDPTTRASVPGLVATPQISANGDVVVFTSFAGGLVTGDFNRLGDVLAFKVPAGATPVVHIGLRPATPGHGPVVTWNATPGWTPVVQLKDSLADPAWRNLPGTPQDDGQGGLLLEDTTSGGDQTRFYRVVLQP
jgi:hypothetical protein